MKIILIELDALHLGFVGCYGNDWIATPHLDRLAADGIVFDRHYADNPTKGPAPPREPELPLAHIAIPALGDFGGRTIQAWQTTSAPLLWISGPSLAPPWHLPEDLENVYFDEDEEAEPWGDPPCDVVGTLSATELLELQNTYAAAVTWFDAQLGALFDYLRKTDAYEHTALIVTANAGLPLGEHGVIGPARAWLYEELVHVPLIVRLPGDAEAGSRIGAVTQPADLVPTLAALLGQDLLSKPGHSLLPLIHADASALRPHAITTMSVGDSVEWALRTSEWAYLLPIRVSEGDGPREPQLYAKPEDRWEVNDVRQHHLELADEMEKTLRNHMQENR